MATLRDVLNNRDYPLRISAAVLGRAMSSDIQLLDTKVSGRHARMELIEGDWFITDLASSNGTRVNGRRIQERTRLLSGDQIDLCGSVLEFHDGSRIQPAFVVKDAEPGSEPLAVIKSLDMSDSARTGVSPEVKLRAILEISRNLGAALNLSEVLPKILESLLVLFPQADRGFMLLREPPDGPLMPKAVRHRDPNPSLRPSISRTVLDHVL